MSRHARRAASASTRVELGGPFVSSDPGGRGGCMPYLHKLSVRQARLCAAVAAMILAACTVSDHDVIGPGNVSELLIFPTSVSIDPGQALQFRAVGRTPSGETQPVPVRWLATGGGKIDDNGMYVADDNPGHVEIRATLDRPNLVARADVRNRGGLKQVLLYPATLTVAPGTQAQFSASGI